MESAAFEMTSVAGITVICYLIGQAVKVSPLNSRYIPVIVGVAGGILGGIGLLIMPEFPASDYMTAVAVGVVSGLAATGCNQIAKQMDDSSY